MPGHHIDPESAVKGYSCCLAAGTVVIREENSAKVYGNLQARTDKHLADICFKGRLPLASTETELPMNVSFQTFNVAWKVVCWRLYWDKGIC